VAFADSHAGGPPISTVDWINLLIDRPGPFSYATVLPNNRWIERLTRPIDKDVRVDLATDPNCDNIGG
jgi:hypothetical protein